MSRLKEAKGVAFSVKMRPEAKAKVASLLKVYAAEKGLTAGEALEHLVDTVGTYGELPKVTVDGLNKLTAAMSEKLDAIHYELLALSGVISLPEQNENDEAEYVSANDDFDETESDRVVKTRSEIQVKRGF